MKMSGKILAIITDSDLGLENIENKEQAMSAVKNLIDHYNIKQEELYPWIEISHDKMPKEGQEVLVGWLHDDGKIVVVKTVHEIFEGKWVDSDLEKLSEWFYSEVIAPPTYWRAIPQIR